MRCVCGACAVHVHAYGDALERSPRLLTDVGGDGNGDALEREPLGRARA